MAFFTESHFKYYPDSLNESQRTFSKQASRDLTTIFDIFVSYNISDKDIVRGIYNTLTKMGFKVYVDFIIDSNLDRGSVNLNTALTIRKRLENSKSLIYAQSPSAAMSRWMPWELGVVDGHTKRCAILPVLKDGSSYYGRQEYLNLYPVIKSGLYGELSVYSDPHKTGIGQSLVSFIKY